MRTEDDRLRPPWDWPAARDRCLREAQRYTRCPAQAEDVVQEALLRAWKTRSTLRNTGHPMPWLLQITRNEALRSIARSARDHDRTVLVAEPEPGPGPAPGEWTETAAVRLDVQAAMRHLGQDEREMINLRYSDELTHSTIADLMNIPVGTCKVRLHRLRKRLSAMLAEEVPA
ncbi:MAG TPA: sigma-70 family RNA polymerase sigma factor [Solirubrobacteraceae bacterium]|nr:sigma-70 family RNA polymerase sigma factor [Solirubrobacteraceae bacterium]